MFNRGKDLEQEAEIQRAEGPPEPGLGTTVQEDQGLLPDTINPKV